MRKSKLLAVLLTAGIVISAIPGLNVKVAHAEDMYIVEMNVPYHDFYSAYGIDTMENVASSSYVDAVTSATVKQSMENDEGKIAGGTYYELSADEKTSYIRGVKFPVMVDDELRKSMIKEGYDIGDFTMVDDASYKGNYIIGRRINKNSKKMDFYAPPFERTVLINVRAELSTDTSYGDYQIKLSGKDIEKSLEYGTETVYGVILNTRQNGHYPMYAMENIWKNTNIAWSVGFVNESRQCPLRSDRYAAIMGQTIKDITIIKKSGVFTLDIDDIYVPKKTNNSISIDDAKAAAETVIDVNLLDMPDEYKPNVTVPDIEDEDIKISQVSVKNNNNLTKDYKYQITMHDAVPGKYKVLVKDDSKKYADISADAKIKGATPVFKEDMVVLQGAEGGDTIENYFNSIKMYEVTEPDGRVAVYMPEAGIGITNVANLFNEDGVFDGEAEFETIEKIEKNDINNISDNTDTGTNTNTSTNTNTGTSIDTDITTIDDMDGTVLGSGYIFPDDGDYKIKVVSNIYDTLEFTYKKGEDTNDDLYKIDTSFNDKTVTYKNNLYIDIDAKAEGKIKYKSSNKAVAEIDSDGVILVKGAGTVDIEINSETATKNISLLVKPGNISIKSAKNNGKGSIDVKMTKSPRAGYQVKYTSAGKSQTIKSSSPNCKIKGLKSGRSYNISVRSYKRIDGMMYYGAWSAKKSVNVN